LKRSTIIALGIIAIAIIIIAFLGLVMGPPTFSNETLVRKGPISSNWSVRINETTFTGAALWTKFAYYEDESIELDQSIYWGALLYNENGMGWVDDQGQLQDKALTLNNLTDRWQYNGVQVNATQPNGSAAFKFALDNYYLKATFSLPKAEDGSYKYSSLDDAWAAGELYLTVIEW
jgi:hypothetical protein